MMLPTKKGIKGSFCCYDLSFSSITHHDLIFSTLRANEILDDSELWLLTQTIENAIVIIQSDHVNFTLIFTGKQSVPSKVWKVEIRN